MTIDELLPDEPANIVHKRILRGVTFRREPGRLVAECRNAAQGQYVGLVASQLLLTTARKRFRDSSLTCRRTSYVTIGTRGEERAESPPSRAFLQHLCPGRKEPGSGCVHCRVCRIRRIGSYRRKALVRLRPKRRWQDPSP